MIEIGVQEAESSLNVLLDHVERGEEVRITRNGKPVATLAAVRKVPEADRQRAFEALADLDRLAKDRNTGPFDWEEWKSYRDEGRR